MEGRHHSHYEVGWDNAHAQLTHLLQITLTVIVQGAVFDGEAGSLPCAMVAFVPQKDIV